ncbi:MAG TPA: hypothetical protein VGQ09_08205 [Chitinophagaceae bacterium]|jgi:hypothetical protein|nr:hypothetical protein [Chitinophagaceae bacterium]
MKYLIFIITLTILVSCNSQQPDREKQLTTRIDSLEDKLNNSYSPGFGEFMSSIQMHHAKLWFAGINNNWKLADFEIHEIQEALEDIQKFNTDRPESKVIGMINPAIDSVSNAIKRQNEQLFKNSYSFLTNTCNNCHKATEHEFNMVTVPSVSPVSNQDFKSVQ